MCAFRVLNPHQWSLAKIVFSKVDNTITNKRIWKKISVKDQSQIMVNIHKVVPGGGGG